MPPTRPAGSSIPMITSASGSCGPPRSAPLQSGGQDNVEFGTYVAQITNPGPTSAETGGDHYYHDLNLPNTGQWTQVIINMYPQHYRSEPGGEDPTNTVYPTATNGPNGGDDPPNTYNYFDTLTRFYFDEGLQGYTTGSWLFDDFQFYQSPYPQDDAQVSSLSGTYNPSNNEVTVTWDRPKNDNTVNDDVRYSFSDIDQIGWNAATPAPNGILTPPGSQGYSGMVYDTTSLPLAGHSVVYIAIKPENSPNGLFSEIAVPIYGVGQNPTPVSKGAAAVVAATPASTPGAATNQLGIEAVPAHNRTRVPCNPRQPIGFRERPRSRTTTTQQGQPVPQGPRFAAKAKPVQPPQLVDQPQLTLSRLVVNDGGPVRHPSQLLER